MHSDDIASQLMSSHSSNLPLSENTENDSQLTQMDHPDSIDGKCVCVLLSK